MAARSTINYVIAAIVIIGILCIVGGVVLVYLGAKGDSTIVAFGFDVKTQSVGIGGIVLGAIVTVTGLRQVLNIIGDFSIPADLKKGETKERTRKSPRLKKPGRPAKRNGSKSSGYIRPLPDAGATRHRPP